MRFNLIIHFKNDEELSGTYEGSLSGALDALVALSKTDPEFDVEDVQFVQVEPTADLG